jgi:NAD(P)-dependent dehydrogenase (short-subunit alcohol dehydrogenase family)
LITGAARGLGQACALACANAGADIALGLRDINTGSALVKEIEALGRRVLPLQMNMLSMDEIRGGVEKAANHFGRLDILVNNAGGGKCDLVEDVKEEDFDLVVNMNLKGTYFASQAAGRIMIKQKYGRIVNLGSQAGEVALPTESVYCMAKAGVAHMTRCMAVEWGKYNINVNNVAPTFIRTPGTQEMLSDDKFRGHVLSMIKLGRIGEPMEVAGTVVFLASPAASLITGATILVDGGWTAH